MRPTGHRVVRHGAASRPAALTLALVLFGLSVSVAGPASTAAAAGTTTVVDSVQAAQSVQQTGVGSTGSTAPASAGTVLGGERDVQAVILTGPADGRHRVQTGAVASTPRLFSRSDPGVSGRTVLVWDGVDGDPDTVARDGLGAVDLTDGATHDVLLAEVGTDTAGVTATWTLWSGPGACSTFASPVPIVTNPGSGPTAVAAPFRLFTLADGCTQPANPAAIGAVALVLDGGAAPGATTALGRVFSASLDHGDLPESYGATTTAESGAAHAIDETLGLGATVTAEADGTHSPTAAADTGDDGIALAQGLTWTAGTAAAGAGGSLAVSVVGSGCLTVWADLDGDGTLVGAGDLVATGRPVGTGTVTLRFDLPSGFTVPRDVIVRARLQPQDAGGGCSASALTGIVSGGEVEDTLVRPTPPPTPPTITAAPASPGSSRAPTWGFSAPTDATPGSTVSCVVLDPSGAPVAPPASCSSGWTALLSSAAPDGPYTLVVTTSDPLGRTATTRSAPYVLDTLPPGAPVLTSGPASPSAQDRPRWDFRTESGSTGRCRLLRGLTTVRASAPCDGSATYDLTGEPDATYTFEVVAVDGAGNTGPVTSGDLVLDRVPPPAPRLTSGPSSPTSSRSVAWSFTLSSDATAACRLTGPDGRIIAESSACSSPFSAALTATPDGAYTFTATARDAAGNTSGTTTSTVVLDTTPPSVAITAAPASPWHDPLLRWSFVVDEAGATASCRVERTAPGSTTPVVEFDWAPCSGTATYDATARADGTWTFLVRATDRAGNTGAVTTASAVLDRVPPPQPVLTRSPSTPRSDASVSWAFSSSPDATVLCGLGGPDGQVAAAAPCSGTVAYDLSAQRDGTFVLTIIASDQAGNSSAPTTSTVELDRAVPGLAITSSPTSPGASRAPRWVFQTETGSTTTCSLAQGTRPLRPKAPCVGSYTGDLTDLADGDYVFSVQASDAAGNTTAPASSIYTLDTIAPQSPTFRNVPASPGRSRAPTWSFVAESGSTSECATVPTGTATDPPWAPCAGTWTADLTGAPDGDVTFLVRATDAAGNTGAPATSTYRLDTQVAAPLVLTAPASPGNARRVRWTFSVEPDAGASCLVLTGTAATDASTGTGGTGGPAGTPSPCSSPFDADLSRAPDGDVVLELQATDTAGNISALSRSTIVLDTMAPASPTLTASPPSPTASRSPTWSLSGPTDGVTSCRVVRGGTVVSDWTPCSGTYVADLAGQPDGDYTLQLRAEDAAGNRTGILSSSPLQLRSVAPGAPELTGGPGPGGNMASLTWSFRVPAGTAASCSLARDGAVISDWAPCAGSATYNTDGMGDGSLVFAVRATSTSGVTGPAASAAFTLDRTAPPAPVITSGPAVSGSTSGVAWTFTEEAGSTTGCRLLRGDPNGPGDWAACSRRYAADLAGQPAGDYAFGVRAVDVWGNIGPAALGRYRYTEVTPPVPPSTASPSAAPSSRVSSPTPRATEKVVVPAPPPATTAPVAPPAGPAASPPAPPPAPRPSAVASSRAAAPILRAAVPPPSPPLPQAAPPERPRTPLEAVGGAAITVLQATRDHAALPLALFVLVVLFLVVQDRLDRSDPKLALAPVATSSEWAEFR